MSNRDAIFPARLINIHALTGKRLSRCSSKSSELVLQQLLEYQYSNIDSKFLRKFSSHANSSSPPTFRPLSALFSPLQCYCCSCCLEFYASMWKIPTKCGHFNNKNISSLCTQCSCFFFAVRSFGFYLLVFFAFYDFRCCCWPSKLFQYTSVLFVFPAAYSCCSPLAWFSPMRVAVCGDDLQWCMCGYHSRLV